jgi:hypothetical protein
MLRERPVEAGIQSARLMQRAGRSVGGIMSSDVGE